MCVALSNDTRNAILRLVVYTFSQSGSYLPSVCMHSEGYSTSSVFLFVRLSVVVHVYAQQTSQKATPKGSALYTGFIFKNGDFHIKVLRSKLYGMKTKSRSQYANYHRLTSTGSACSVYLEGKRSLNEGCVSTPACYLLL